MHDHRVDPHRLQQHHVFGEFARGAFVAHGVAAVFHDEAAARIALEVGQRLDQRFGLGVDIGCLAHRRRSSAPLRRRQRFVHGTRPSALLNAS